MICVLPAEIHHPGEKVPVRHRRRGVVGVVEKEGLGVPGRQGIDVVQIRQKGVFPPQGHKMAEAPGEQGAHLVHRVARRGHQVDVLGIDDPQGQVGNALLGADEGEDLAGRVQLHPEALGVPAGHRLPEEVQAGVGRIAVGAGVLHRGHHLLHDEPRRGQVGVTHAQVDDIHSPGLDFGLLLVNRLKEIGRDQAQSRRGFEKICHLFYLFANGAPLRK